MKIKIIIVVFLSLVTNIFAGFHYSRSALMWVNPFYRNQWKPLLLPSSTLSSIITTPEQAITQINWLFTQQRAVSGEGMEGYRFLRRSCHPEEFHILLNNRVEVMGDYVVDEDGSSHLSDICFSNIKQIVQLKPSVVTMAAAVLLNAVQEREDVYITTRYGTYHCCTSWVDDNYLVCRKPIEEYKAEFERKLLQ